MTDSNELLPTPTRVLVLDDDVLICQLLERSLQRRGFTVITETSPADALARLKDEECDLVISDVNMEGLDGLAFTQRVIALNPDLPVILITGSSTMEIAMNAVLAGAWDFLSKPIDAKLLELSINRACKHRQLKKELRELRAMVDGADFRTSSAPPDSSQASGSTHGS
jgi:two-component system response regulator HydG